MKKVVFAGCIIWLQHSNIWGGRVVDLFAEIAKSVGHVPVVKRQKWRSVRENLDFSVLPIS